MNTNLKIFNLALFLFFLIKISPAQDLLKSPTEYLGYKYGTEIPTFDEINRYFNYLAAHSPNVKLVPYGKSYERRPLNGFIISSEDNIRNLNSIRAKQLKGMEEKISITADDPLIAWLSYSVHGNEIGATSTAPVTAYTLLTEYVELLDDVVIILDPCVNPDGYSRYTEWYNREASSEPESRHEIIEHNEPWPGGRGNHYLFDLNRDWAWATQIESRQRLGLYHQWMPHLHIDFHEQSPDAWYFFPPPAEPIHPYISEFQRDIQDSFGLANARKFDEKGWPYYTEEIFDLYYPSYGDTYPLFNGSIGMTYEQAGHGRAGRAFNLRNGDTLYLQDRIDHHNTTGITSLKRGVELKEEILNAQVDFFKDGRKNKTKDIEAYIVICESENQRSQLKDFLKMHQIHTESYASGVKVKGYSYRFDESKSITTTDYSLLIPCRQPQSRLIHVLMEPESEISNSMTYDITAWAIPYLWGLETVALKRLPPKSSTADNQLNTPDKTIFNSADNILGYTLDYKTWEDIKELAQIMKKGYRVRAYKPENKTPYFLLLKADNKSTPPIDLSAKWNPIQNGSSLDHDIGSAQFRLLKRPEVLLVQTDKARSDNYGFIWYFFEKELDYPVHRVALGKLANYMKEYNTLIFPSGYYSLDSATELKLQEFIKSGGTVIFMRDAYNVANGIKPIQVQDKTFDKFNPGALVRINLDNEKPLAWGMKSTLDCFVMGNRAFTLPEDGEKVGYLEKWQTGKGYITPELKDGLEDSVRFGYKKYGSGNAVYLFDDPVFRAFWERGKQLFTNAIILM